METIKTRIQTLRALDIPTTWCNKTNHLNPNDRIFITTEKPASEMSIEELEQFIEDKKAQAIIAKAFVQYYEAIDILKAFGAEVETEIIGLEKLDWLKDKKEE
jgi:hypothetical protein